MAQSYRAAIHVYSLRIETCVANYRERLCRECFVQLDHVDVLELQTGELERLWNRDDRANPHDLGWHSADSERDEASHGLQAQLACFLFRHYDRGCGSIAGLRRVAGRHDATEL